MIINNSFQYNTYHPEFAGRLANPAINLSKKELQSLIAKGLTVQEIATESKCSLGYVYKLLHFFGINTLKQKRINEIQQQMKVLDEKMPLFLPENATLKNIMQETGFNEYVIQKWCQEKLNMTLSESKTETRLERVKEFNEQGLDNKEISKNLGISPVAVRKFRQKHGLVKESQRKQELADLILEKSKLGIGVKEIAKQLNLALTTVSRYRTLYGVKSELKKNREQIIEDMLKQGFSLRQIARKLNLTEGYVYKYTNACGLRSVAKQYKQAVAKQIVEKYNQGVPIFRIAQEMNVSVRTVVYKIHDYKANSGT